MQASFALCIGLFCATHASFGRCAGIYRVKENAYEDQKDSYDEDMAQFTEEISGVSAIIAVIQTLLDAC